jgi:hypothetical protein
VEQPLNRAAWRSSDLGSSDWEAYCDDAFADDANQSVGHLRPVRSNYAVKLLLISLTINIATTYDHKEINMKTQSRIATVTLLAVLCLILAGSASAADLYDNGPTSGDQTAWTINFGLQVSDSFILQHAAPVRGFQFAVWALPGDAATSVDWSIGTNPFGSTFGGTACVTAGPGCNSTLVQSFLTVNAYGYDLDLETVTGLTLPLAGSTTYYLTLQNAQTAQSAPLYWDENSGRSLAFENDYGSIPSESFTINGGTTPEPGSLMLLGSGALGLGGLLRRRLLG